MTERRPDLLDEEFRLFQQCEVATAGDLTEVDEVRVATFARRRDRRTYSPGMTLSPTGTVRGSSSGNSDVLEHRVDPGRQSGESVREYPMVWGRVDTSCEYADSTRRW